MSAKDLTEEELHDLVERLKDPLTGIKLKTNKFRMKTHKSSFAACKLVDWLVETKTVPTRPNGEEVGNKLSEAGLILLLTGTGTLFKDSTNIWRFVGINTPPDTPSRVGSGSQGLSESPRRTLSVSGAHDIQSPPIRTPQRSQSTAVEIHSKPSPPHTPPPPGLPPPLPKYTPKVSSSKTIQTRTGSMLSSSNDSHLLHSHSHGHSSSPPSTPWNYKAGLQPESTDIQKEPTYLRTASSRRIFPTRSGLKTPTELSDESKQPNTQSPKHSQDASFLQMFVTSHSDLSTEIGTDDSLRGEVVELPLEIHRPRAHSQLHSSSPYKSNDTTKGSESAPQPTIPENLTRRKTLQFVSHTELFTIWFVNEGIKKNAGINTEIKIRPLSDLVQKVCVQRGLNMNEYTAKDSSGNVVAWSTLVGDLSNKEIYLEEKSHSGRSSKRTVSRNRTSSEWFFTSSADRSPSSPVVSPPPSYQPPPLSDRLTDSMISDSGGENISKLVVRFTHDESKKTLLLSPEQKQQTLRESIRKICTVRNLKMENYTAKDSHGTELDMDRLMGEINIHEVVMEPSDLEGPPPPTYIPKPPDTSGSPPLSGSELFSNSHNRDKTSSRSHSSSEESESFTVPKVQEREVPQIACTNVTQADPWHLESPSTSPQRVVLLKGGTIARWSREACWAVLCGNRSLNVVKENPTFFQLEKVGGRDHTLRIGVCGSQLSHCGNKHSFGLKCISSLYLHGKWFAYRIRPPCRTGDKLGFIVDHKSLIVYKNYKIIEILELDPTLFDNPLFPFVALCGDIQVAITPFPDLEKYAQVKFTHGPKQQVEPLIPSGLSELLDDLKVVKFKPYLEKYTLESLTLDVLDEIGLPEQLKNLIWQSRNQALGLWWETREDETSRRRSSSEDPSKHSKLNISSFSSSTPW